MDKATHVIEEEKRLKSVRLIGQFLIAAFFCPIAISMFGSSKILFPNISELGKGSIINNINLLHPLLAGIAVLWVGYNLWTVARPVIFLAAGFLPFILTAIEPNNIFSAGFGNVGVDMLQLSLVMFSLIGIYVGSRLLAANDHQTNRLIGGISGMVFLVSILLPITGQKPLFFSLFDFYKLAKSFGQASIYLLATAIIAIFLCYIWAALIAALNMTSRPDTEVLAERAQTLVFRASLALPIAILVCLSFGAFGFLMIATTVAKMTLLFGGILGAIAVGFWDLGDQLIPQIVKGTDLITRSDNPGSSTESAV